MESIEIQERSRLKFLIRYMIRLVMICVGVWFFADWAWGIPDSYVVFLACLFVLLFRLYVQNVAFCPVQISFFESYVKVKTRAFFLHRTFVFPVKTLKVIYYESNKKAQGLYFKGKGWYGLSFRLEIWPSGLQDGIMESIRTYTPSVAVEVITV